MTQPSDRPVPSEEEMDRIFAEQHERAVLELAIERREKEAREKREREQIVPAPAVLAEGEKERWCSRCSGHHVPGDQEKCEEQFQERITAERERREEANALQRSRVRDRIPTRFRDAEADHPKVHAWAHRWEAEDFDGTAKESLLLTGPVGTGKTYQMFGVMNVAIQTDPFERFEFANVPALLTALRPSGDEVDLERFKKADWLFLDDLTGHKASEWSEERLYELINYRYEYQLATVLTTNTTAKELGAVLGERIASRLAEMCEVVAITGKDRRRAR